VKLSPFDTYKLYLSVKNHFSRPTYDFFKYQGKTKASITAFEKRRDRFFFDKLSKKYEDQELVDLFVSNILIDKTWVGDYLEEDGHDTYIKYMRRKQSFSYTFTNELEKAFMSVSNIKCLFQTKPNEYPQIIQLHMNGVIGIDTLGVLNRFIKFSDKFNSTIGEDDVIWSKIRIKCEKVTPFLDYDETKLKTILKQKMDEYHG
jgi:hypothetical protein